MNHFHFKGNGVVWLIIVGFGLWLLWRGITNNIPSSGFGEALIPRWMFVVAGLLCVLLGVGLFIFVLYPSIT